MAERMLTDAQKNAVLARGNVLVSAAAGSGKTFVLSRRVLERITGEDGTDIDRLLIVTFTNAAAAEMRDRIRADIEKELEQLSGEETADAATRRERLLRQRALLPQADITTIDAFCASLVREHFESTDLPQDFRTGNDALLQAMREEAFEETVRYYTETGDAEFEAAVRRITCGKSDEQFKNLLFRIHEYLGSIPYPQEWMRAAVARYEDRHPERTLWFSELLEEGGRTLREILRLLGKIGEFSALDPVTDKAFSKETDEARTATGFALEKLRVGDWDAVCSALTGIVIKTHTSSKEKDEILFAAANYAAKSAAKLLEELRNIFCMPLSQITEELRTTAPAVRKLMEATELFRGNFLRRKQESGQFEFADIEAAALRLLVSRQAGESHPTAAGERICARYDEVMVDEYQDVNDLQNELFRVLSGGEAHFFTVGDIKQSIYRFRLAAPRNFLRRMQSLPAAAREKSAGALALSGNFRSRTGVCDFVNYLFSRLMCREVGGVEYGEDQRLVALNQTYPRRAESDVRIRLTGYDKTGSAAQAEAECIAAELWRMTRTPCVSEKVTVRDEAGEREEFRLRPARFSDAAILLRSRTHAEKYLQVLRRRGIPVWSDAEQPLTASPAVLRVISILRVVQYPTEDVSMLSALLSPVFGFTPDSLAQLRAGQRGVSIYESLRCGAESREDCRRALKTLRKLRLWAAQETLPDLIRRLLEQTGLQAAVRAGENGAAESDALTALWRVAGTYAQTGGELSGFLQLLASPHAQQFKVPLSAGSGEGAVRIMTVHHSKGLEFPICFLAGLSKPIGQEERKERCLIDAQAGIGLYGYDEKLRLRYTTPLRESLCMSLDREAVAEELRIFYVAATRARETLYCILSAPEPEKLLLQTQAQLLVQRERDAGGEDRLSPSAVRHAGSWQDWLLPLALMHPAGEALRAQSALPLFPPHDVGEAEFALFTPEEALPEEKEEPPLLPAEETEEMTERLTKALCWRYPYAALGGIRAKMAVTQLTEKRTAPQTDCTARPAFLSKGGLTPAQRGVAAHTFLEYADFSAVCTDTEAEIARLVQAGHLSERQAAALERDRLARFFASSVFVRVCRSPKVYREMRFMCELPALRVQPDLPENCREETVVVQGIADCVFLEGDGAVILDYKTDTVKDGAVLRERYAGQLALYAEALEKVLGCPVKEKILYSLCLGEEICV